jgi:hypothetical protein
VADDSSIPIDHDDANLSSDPDDSDARDTAETTGETPQNPQADEATEDPHEGAVPPGYDWPTHGGYLGCLLSLMASCLIGGFLGTTLFPALGYSHAVPKVVAAVLTVVVYLAIAVGLGRLGWILGKRYYREYPQTREKRENSEQALSQGMDSMDNSETRSSSFGAIDMPIDTH